MSRKDHRYPKLILAPFTPEEAAALNRWQEVPDSHHLRLTCGFRHPEFSGPGILHARTAGLVCPHPDCDWTQDWALEIMLRPPGEGVSLPED